MFDLANEVECKVCHRLSFESSEDLCPKCDWPIRPRELAEPVYGHEGLIEYGSQIRPERKEIRRKGPAKLIEKAARALGGKVLAIRALSHRSWIGAFGEGRM